MSNKVNKISLVIAFGLAFGGVMDAGATITLTWSNNCPPLPVAPLPYTKKLSYCPSVFTDAFADGNEYRMVSPACAIGGGGEKSIMDGGETWVFSGDFTTGGTMTGVTGTPSNAGSTVAGSAAPSAGTNPTLNQNAPFFTNPFNFLAPTNAPSLAGTAYGFATISAAAGDNFTIFFPVMEAQWGGTWFPLGQATSGITFNCTGATLGNVVCHADHIIQVSEDPGTAGFSNWTAQWELIGTTTGAFTNAVCESVKSPSSGNLPSVGDANGFLGGCAMNARAEFDPGLLAMLLGSFGYLAWRRKRRIE